MVERQDGPFDYYQDIHAGVNGDTIRTDAENPGLDAATIEALAGELDADSRQVASDISGDITAQVQANPETLAGSARSLAGKGHFAVGVIKQFAGMVDTFDTTVNRLNGRYRTDLASAMRWAGQAAASTEDAADDGKVDEAHLGPGIKANLQPEYNTALSTLDDDADTIAGKFKEGPTLANVRELIRAGLLPLTAAVLYPGLTLTDEDKSQYYQNALSHLSPEEQREWIEANIENLDPAAAPYVDPSIQEYFADQVADAIKDPENITASTVALMNFFKSQQAYADTLYDSVSPNEMSDAIVHLNQEIFKGSGPDRYANQDPRELVSMYDTFMNSAGVALATHSNSPDVDPKALADEWFNAITDDSRPMNAATLTLLIREGGEQREGTFNPDFIDTVATKSLEWEKTTEPLDPSAGGVWGSRTGGLNIMDPDQITLNNVQDLGGGLWSYTGYGTNSHDGMANLLAGMGHSPTGAQQFFMNDDGTVDKDKLDYLMLHRTFSGSKGSDEGDGLGEALQAAVMGGTNGEDGFSASSADTLTSDVFRLISENSSIEDKDDLGQNPYGGQLDGDTDNGWHIWEQMSDSLGAIGANYADDIYAEVGPGTGADSRLSVDERDLLRVVAEIGGTDDQTGLQTLLAGVANAGVNHEVGSRLDQFVTDQAGPPQQPVDMQAFRDSGMTLNTRNIGETLGKLINASDDVYSDKEMTSSRRAELAAKAFELGTSFLPGAGKIIGEGGSQILTTAIDTGKGELIGQMQNAIKGDGPQAPASHSGSINDSVGYAISNQFLQHGLLGEQADPKNGADATYPGVHAAQNPLTTTNSAGQPIFNPDLYYGTTDAGDNSDWDRWVNSTPYDLVDQQAGDMTDGLDAELNQQLAHGNTQD